MVDYPNEFPAEAVQVVFHVAANGFAPDGQHNDQGCFYNALWNLQGYGLGIYKPHHHLMGEGRPPRPMKLGRFAPQKNEKKLIEVLAKQLEPVRSRVESAAEDDKGDVDAGGGRSGGKNDAAQKADAEAVDWSKIPWSQVIMLVTLILQSLLKKEPA